MKKWYFLIPLISTILASISYLPQELNPEQQAQAQMNIGVDKLCPPFAESGSAVVCEPVEGYPLGVVSHITATQEGSGDPSPDNIRPINGYGTVKLVRGSKNFLNVPEILTFTRGTTVSTTIPAGTYKLTWKSATSDGTNVPCAIFKSADSENSFIFSSEKNGSTITFTVEITAVTFYSNVSGWTGSEGISTTIIQLMLSTEGGEYEPYRGETFELDFGETVYGGTLDWNTGVLTMEKKVLVVDGANLAFADVSGYWNLPQQTTPGVIYAIEFVNSHLQTNCFASNPNLGFIYAIKQNITEFASVEEFNTYLIEQNAAGTPLQILYDLEEPITIQLTPQEILALSGTNTLYSDTGDTEVTGRANPAAIINNLLDRLAAIEAAVVNNA